MKQLEGIQNSLPDDIALKIASSLQVSDVCSLGSCSRFWRDLCGSDCVWASLYRERWPALDFAKIKNPQIESALMAEYIMEALNSCKISEREVCVRWWKLGRWFNGFRLRDESHSRTFSLADIAMAKEDAVLGVLHRGAIHEVLRVQISVAKPVCTPWSFQSSPTQN